jgi:hypothetical protein
MKSKRSPATGSRREAQRPRVGVGGDDLVGMGREVQGLDAGAGSQVERPLDLGAHRQLGERGRGAADAEDVVASDHAGAAAAPCKAGAQVGDDVPVVHAVAVRPDVDDRPGLDAVAHDQAEGLRVVARQCGARRGGLDRLLEDEQPGQRLQGRVTDRRAQARDDLAPGQRRGRGSAQQLGHPVDGVADLEQGRPQPRAGRRVDGGHGRRQTVASTASPTAIGRRLEIQTAVTTTAAAASAMRMRTPVLAWVP